MCFNMLKKLVVVSFILDPHVFRPQLLLRAICVTVSLRLILHQTKGKKARILERR